MSESKLKEAQAETAVGGDRCPVVVGTRDGSCFYGEASFQNFVVALNKSPTGSIALTLYNCQMILGMSQTTRGWFDLAGRGPDASCVVSPPVDCAEVGEITKILSCTLTAAARWKAQGSSINVAPRIIPARNQ